jgi:hypothetical protein
VILQILPEDACDKLFLCTGGVSNALFISLLISKFFCSKGCMGGVGGGERDIVNSLCPARKGEGVVSGTK